MYHLGSNGLSGRRSVTLATLATLATSGRSQGRSRPWLPRFRPSPAIAPVAALAPFARVAAVAATLALGVTSLAPPPGFAHDSGEAAVVLRPDRVVRGGTVGATGADFFGGDSLDVRFVVGSDSRSIGTVVAGDDGHFTTLIVIPANVPVGPAALDFVSKSGIVQRVLLSIDPGDPIEAPGPSDAGLGGEAPGDSGGGAILGLGIAAAGAVLAAVGVLAALIATRVRRAR